MKKKPKEKSKNGERKKTYKRESDIFIFFFFLFFSSDLQKLDCRFSSEQKAKLIYATRATHGHQNLGVLSNSTR